VSVPEGLRAGGRALWRGVTEAHDLDPVQVVILTEACRAKDRLDRLDSMMREGRPWLVLTRDGTTAELQVDTALVTTTGDLLKRLLVSLRLPDRYGRRPQRRGTPRGVYRLTGTR